MNFKALIAAVAISSAAFTASVADASTILVRDGGGDDTTFPTALLTLDPDAVDTAGSFDTTSNRFQFIGEESSSDTFMVETTSETVLEFGNVVTSADYTKAELTVAGRTIDLLTQGSVFVGVPIASSPFTVTLDFVSTSPAATYDFTLIATKVPVPAGVLLMGTALAGFGVMRRRKKAA